MNVEYIVREQKPVIVIRGRLGKERKVKYIYDFRPYFYVLKEEKDKAIEMGLEVEEVEDKSVIGEEIVKVYSNLPTDVPGLRGKFSKSFEANILFPVRFIVDREEWREIDSGEIRVGFLDMEMDDENGLPTTINPPEIYMVSIYDSYKECYVIFVYHPSSNIGNEIEFDGKKVKVLLFNEERRMLEEFINFIGVCDFDILTGWNVKNFDFPVFIERCKKLGVDFKKLSPFNDVSWRQWGKVIKGNDVRIKGRTVFDLYTGYRNIFGESKSYRLDYIGKKEVGMGKLEKVQNKVCLLWRNSLKSLVEYNLQDVKICVEIDKKLDIIKFFEERRKIAGCLWDSLDSSISMIDTVLLRWGRKNNIVFPTFSNEREERYRGAVVMQPNKGLYENVMSMDFQRLYPSIMINFNISPETCIQDGNIKLENGVSFTTTKKGIIPQLFDELFKLRKGYQLEMKKYEKGSDMYKLYYNKQFATKNLINAIYGVLGNGYFRMSSQNCARSVTYLGRELINKVKEMVDKMGLQFLYGDTDSSFILLPTDKLNGSNVIEEYGNINKLLNKGVNDYVKDKYGIDSNFVLDMKNLYKKILFTNVKKRYAGWIIWDEGKEADMVEIVGFENRRSDISEFTEELQKIFFEKLLKESTDIAVKIIIENFERIKQKNIPYEKISQPKGIKKAFSSYKSNTPWLRGTMYTNKYLGGSFKEGEKVKILWVKKINGKYPPTDVVAFVDGFYIPDEFEPDYDKIIEDNIGANIRRLFESLNLDYDSLILGKQKMVVEI